MQEIYELNYASKESIESDIGKANRCGAFMATTIKSQTGAKKALEESGFEPVSEFFNPNSANTVTVWIKKVHQPVKKSKTAHT
jgi:hypothetical protein